MSKFIFKININKGFHLFLYSKIIDVYTFLPTKKKYMVWSLYNTQITFVYPSQMNFPRESQMKKPETEISGICTNAFHYLANDFLLSVFVNSTNINNIKGN